MPLCRVFSTINIPLRTSCNCNSKTTPFCHAILRTQPSSPKSDRPGPCHTGCPRGTPALCTPASRGGRGGRGRGRGPAPRAATGPSLAGGGPEAQSCPVRGPSPIGRLRGSDLLLLETNPSFFDLLCPVLGRHRFHSQMVRRTQEGGRGGGGGRSLPGNPAAGMHSNKKKLRNKIDVLHHHMGRWTDDHSSWETFSCHVIQNWTPMRLRQVGNTGP